MQKLEIEFENELDLTLLDNEFFVAMLNQIMLFQKVRDPIWIIPKLKFTLMVVILLECHTKNNYERNKKSTKVKQKGEMQDKVKELYKKETGTKKEKTEKVIEKINEKMKDEEKGKRDCKYYTRKGKER